MEWDYTSIPLEDRINLLFWKKMHLDLTADHHRIAVREAIETGDTMAALMQCGYTYLIPFMLDNWLKLQEVGMYEKALAYALTIPRVNRYLTSLETVHFLLEMADKKALKAEGDPIPNEDNFTLYRGYSAKNTAKPMVGLLWTSDIERAKWHALDADNLENPAISKAIAPKDAIYLYNNQNREQEFICAIPRGIKTECVWKG
jgi:hypothetical protein